MGLSLTAQQTNRKRTEPEGVGAVPAHARGEGREVRERERQKRQKSLQINGIVLAAPGVGMEWGRGPFPGGARRWEVARTKRNTTPKWAPDAPKPPSRSHPPDTRERHGPPPHSDNPKRHSLPSHGQTYSPWNPHERDGPPSQRSLTRRCLPKRLSHGQHKPSQHQDTPTQGRNGSRGPPSGESGILEPLGEKTIQRDAQSYSKCCRTDTLIGEMGEGQRHLFRGASETAFPWKESRPKTDLS